jgi:hypothetical protein
VFQNNSRKIRNFVNPGKRSNIKNAAPDPGSCIRVKSVAAQQELDFYYPQQDWPGRRRPEERHVGGGIILPPQYAWHDWLPRTLFRR